MSELKAIRGGDIHDDVIFFYNSDSEDRSDVLYYLKSEADNVIAYNKFKRCIGMAQEWRNYAAFCGMQSSCHNHRGFGKTAEKYTWKEFHAWKCVKRYKELAEKFKSNNEVNNA